MYYVLSFGAWDLEFVRKYSIFACLFEKDSLINLETTIIMQTVGEKNIHFSAPVNDFKSLIYTPDFKLAEITVNGSVHKAIVKEIQAHPVTDQIIHIDFVELVPNKPLKAEVPLRLVGQSDGAKIGGAVIQKMRHATVKATPENLVDALEVDITELVLGDSARVRDIKPVEGLEILNNPSSPVVSIEIPRAVRSAQADEAAEAAAAEAAGEGEEGAETEATE